MPFCPSLDVRIFLEGNLAALFLSTPSAEALASQGVEQGFDICDP